MKAAIGSPSRRHPAALAATLLAGLLLAACAAAPGAPSGPQLAGRTYLSTSVQDAGADRPLVPGTRIAVTFTNDGQLGITAGCNRISGGYRVQDGLLVTDLLGMTEMGCDQDRMAQDQWLADVLGSKPRVNLVGNDLTLTAGDTVIRLLDREIAEPDQPLLGTVWSLSSIIAGDTVSSVPLDAPATLQFLDTGEVRIQPGCNTGSGRFESDGTTLRVGQVALTKMACPGPAGEVENAVLAVLRADRLSIQIDAATLTLIAPDGKGLGLTATGA